MFSGAMDYHANVDGVQNKVLEAMSTGKPVVATDIPIQGIFATPGKELISAHTSHQFAQAVIDLLVHGTDRERLGRHARRYIFDHHNWDKNLTRETRNPSTFHQILVFVSKNQDVRY